MNFREKKVLVTGGAGFIGSNLVDRLVKEGASVTVLDSMAENCGGNPFNLSSFSQKIVFKEMDIGHDDVRPFIENQEYIFNLAGSVSHEDSMTHPQNDMKLNASAHLNFLENCRKYNKDAVILYASTRQFYGTPQYLPVDEKHPIRPLDVNGIHKLAAESYHMLYGKVYDMKAISLRLTNTYGPRQLIKHSRQGVIGWFVNRAVTGNKIQLFGDGTQIRDFTFVDDAVEAMLTAVQNSRCFGEIYNLGGEKTTLKDVAQRLLAFSGNEGNLEIIPFPASRKKIDIGDYYGTCQKLTNASGWKPQTSLNDGLRKTLGFFEKNKKHYLE